MLNIRMVFFSILLHIDCIQTQFLFYIYYKILELIYLYQKSTITVFMFVLYYIIYVLMKIIFSGTNGFFMTFWFIKKIYSAVKVDYIN